MMIPVVTRTAEVIFRLVPGPLREASYALGSSQFRTVWNVVLPTARSGLATAVILAMARAVGETSPVLLTAGFTKEMNANPFSEPQTSLPLYIYNYVRYPQATMVERAFGAGLALMIMVLTLFVLARIIGGRPPGELSRRQRRRLVRDRRVAPADPDPSRTGAVLATGLREASVKRFYRDWSAVFATAIAVASMSVGSAHAATYAQLNGDGSSWAGPAIDQFGRDVHNQGLVINYNPDGSAAGRSNFTQNAADFAATDVQYLTQGDPFGGGVENPTVAYSYIPIVAGGTAFMYNLTVGGHKITDLRLSGDTITKIFTGQITNWDDSRITKDYGRALPSQKITPITRSDGSGATYQFTRWMAHEYASQWDAFCGSHGGPSSNCGPTEFYPGFSGSQQRGGSDQVANYISAGYGAGSIGYDEYAYALQSSIPVLKVLNPAGYFTLPTASNVAIALQAATIDENPASVTFLIQNLDNVYTNKDPRSYPLSSYSYLIVARTTRTIGGQAYGPPGAFTTAKGVALSTWLNYVLCGAQQEAGALGYSPLPKNLVVGGFQQTDYIPGHVPTPDLNNLNNCNNPTYHNGVNYLIKDAPQPSPCDKLGAPLTCSTTGSTKPRSHRGPRPRRSSKTAAANGQRIRRIGPRQARAGRWGHPRSAGAAPGAAGATSGAAGPAAVKTDPDTGQTIGATDGANGTTINAQPVSVSGAAGGNGLFASLAGLEILAAVLVPGLLGYWLQKRRRPS